MEPNRLFIVRCEQVAQLLQSDKEIDVLDLAARLRQLLLDGGALAHAVNANRLKLRFHVGPLSESIKRPPFGLLFFSQEDGIDPQTSQFPQQRLELDLKNFLAHPVMLISGKTFSVKDVIRHLAVVAGGVHHAASPDKDYEKYKVLSDAGQFFSIGGLPAGVRILKAIGRVALRGLQPLIQDVKVRMGVV